MRPQLVTKLIELISLALSRIYITVQHRGLSSSGCTYDLFSEIELVGKYAEGPLCVDVGVIIDDQHIYPACIPKKCKNVRKRSPMLLAEAEISTIYGLPRKYWHAGMSEG